MSTSKRHPKPKVYSAVVGSLDGGSPLSLNSSSYATGTTPTEQNASIHGGSITSGLTEGYKSTPPATTNLSVNLLANSTPTSQTSPTAAPVSRKNHNNLSSLSRTANPNPRKSVNINLGRNETFQPTSEAYTPKMPRKAASSRRRGEENASGEARDRKETEEMPERPTPTFGGARATIAKDVGTSIGGITRINVRDALKRVSLLLHRHVSRIERRYMMRDSQSENAGLFHTSKLDVFNEDNFVTPKYRYTAARVPFLPGCDVLQCAPVKPDPVAPSSREIYEFMYKLFAKVQLSSECSIVCFIYVERLMERANVPLMTKTWRPIVLCALLLASKVWQDLSSWNVEFEQVYPRFKLESINQLEHTYLAQIKWDLYISSQQYAKYYFALRSLMEKKDFRAKYNQLAQSQAITAGAMKIQERSVAVKEEVLLQLSRSV